MPTRMRGSAIVLGTLETGVSAFGADGGWDVGMLGCWIGGVGGALVHAARRQASTATRFMWRGYAKTRASRAMPSANPGVGLLGEGQPHGVAAAAVDEKRRAGDVRHAGRHRLLHARGGIDVGVER